VAGLPLRPKQFLRLLTGILAIFGAAPVNTQAMVIPKPALHRLLTNARLQAPLRGTVFEIDFRPVVRVSAPDVDAVWFLSELDPEDFDTAQGLADFGLGPEVGPISLAELRDVRGTVGSLLEVDHAFTAEHTIKGYVAAIVAASAD